MKIMTKRNPIIILLQINIYLMTTGVWSHQRTLGKFHEVFAWKQLTFDIDGYLLSQDRIVDGFPVERTKRHSSHAAFFDFDQSFSPGFTSNFHEPTTTVRPADEAGRFFIQYNNVPMGMERVGDILFVSIPRRRYGIPATLNYIDLKRDSNIRSPPLRPYPNMRQSRSLTSVYRTRADKCGRLWMVDTGLLEIPGAPRQVQAPAIVIYDLATNQQIRRYPLKSSDLITANTPAGLASIAVDIAGDCRNAYAYLTDLATYGIIVYSLRENDSWRLSHNYFYLTPTLGNLRIAGQNFQWSDGIFSITLTEPGRDGCRVAYFHPLISYEEFSVSTCVLRNRTASQDSAFFYMFSKVGDRGENSQCTKHDYHAGSRVVFFAEVGRDAVSCWHTGRALTPSNIAILAQDRQRMSYPSDLHVTGDEVWVIANTLPRFGYSRLDTNEYNFYIYRGNVKDLIAGTVCDSDFQRFPR